MRSNQARLNLVCVCVCVYVYVCMCVCVCVCFCVYGWLADPGAMEGVFHFCMLVHGMNEYR